MTILGEKISKLVSALSQARIQAVRCGNLLYNMDLLLEPDDMKQAESALRAARKMTKTLTAMTERYERQFHES